ncbi:TonB-dependent siderophore receptor [uncultured Albimonas sp.]|uniref:TonB-dependent siderophore receptor n=1 Tax=uncultured Albimonas sp. TaxID=1331701 RepID=UPI0030EEB6FD
MIRPTHLAAAALAALHASPSLAQSAEDATKLEPIVVDGRAQQTPAGPVDRLRALTADGATGTRTPIEEIPQTVQVIPRSMIEAQGAVTAAEVLENVSNVQAVNPLIIGNVDQSPLKIRGFKAEQWVDGFSGNTFLPGDRDSLVNVERIEVLKGPNAIIYGGGAGAPIGGVVNVVTKKPEAEPSREIGATFGSYGHWSPYFDLNQPLTESGTVLFRLTGEYTKADSFIDVIESERVTLNPSLTLTDRRDTSLTIQGFFNRHEQQAYTGLPVTGTLVGPFRVPDDLYFGDPDIEPSTSEQYGVTATFDHRFDKVWSTNVKARWSQSSMDQYAQSAFLDATGTGGTPLLAPSSFDVSNLHHFDELSEFSISPTVQAEFDAGPTRNVVLFGGDYSRAKDKGGMVADTLGNMCFLMGGGCPPVVADLQNPSFPAFTVPQPGVGEGATYFAFDNTYVTQGIFAQVQTTVHERVHLMLGGRLGMMDMRYTENALPVPTTFRTDETRFLPRAGVVVDVLSGVSIFAGYSEGMRWVPFAQTFAAPAPELSKSLEGGVKLDLDGGLSGTLAVFDIERSNVPFQITATTGGLSEQRSQGFEADLLYQPDADWSLLVSYGYADAVFSSAAGPAAKGNRAPMVPEHSGRVWFNYDLSRLVQKGLSAGAGVYAASGQFVDAANTWETDAYFTVDARIGWQGERFGASLSIKNLTGEDYYTPYTWFGGQVAPGAPRSVYAQLSYTF